MTKSEILTILSTLPEEFSAIEIVEKIQLVDKINEGLNDLEEGRTFDHEEVVDIFNNMGRGKSTRRFTENQKRMLENAEQDILHNRVLDLKEMNENDLQWLNEQ